MTRLILVRHGRSAVDTTTAPQHWDLARDAAVGLTALRDSGRLPGRGRWFSSPEPKAAATAAALTDRPVTQIDDLREAERPATWFDDSAEFVATVRRAMNAPDEPAVPGWEPAAATRRRVARAVRTLLDSTQRWTELVLVGHGTAWTLLVAELTARGPDLDAWERMAMPDLAELDVPASGGPATLVRDWSG